MVLLTAAVCTKAGKAIISRQFVEMTKARIEGLLAAFPKLMGSGKQHTFVETESVRYVYQPLEKLYMLLITTKASNILEDLETLRLFSKVIPEYCKNMEESEILENSFNLIFAFDEIVALGYRESVNLAQIRTFVEMDSHEEKVFQAVRQTQEREAKNKMKEKAKELQRARADAAKKGLRTPGFGSMGYQGVNSSYGSSATVIGDSVISPEVKPVSKPSSKFLGSSKAMQLGQKGKDVESFVDQLKSEGENVVNQSLKTSMSNAPVISSFEEPMQPVHLRVEEKINMTAKRDGGLQNLEVHGMVTLRVTDEQFDRLKIHIDNRDDKGIQLQTHPNIDKDLFKTSHVIGLKNPAKPFPFNTDVGVLKWRFQSQNETYIPLSINCWPSENGQNGCDVNIEYELEQEKMELNNVVVTIPIPSGEGSPIVGDCSGDYNYDSRKNILEWHLPVIDASNKSGSMEFTVGGHPNDFFPVSVSFFSKKPYCDLRVANVTHVDTGDEMPFSSDTVFFVEKYEIV
uniref:Coatomer subunit delta n=1 Tax=Strigamia maritima TaxID=126957 RepID=T1IL15_STRMM